MSSLSQQAVQLRARSGVVYSLHELWMYGVSVADGQFNDVLVENGHVTDVFSSFGSL